MKDHVVLYLPRPRGEWPADRWLAMIVRDGHLLGVMCPSGFAAIAPCPGEPLHRALQALEGARCVWLDLEPTLRVPGRWRLRLADDGVFFVLEPPMPDLPRHILPARSTGEGPKGWIERLHRAQAVPIDPDLSHMLRAATTVALTEGHLVATFRHPPGRLLFPLPSLPIPQEERTVPAPARFAFCGSAEACAVAVLPPPTIHHPPSVLLLADGPSGMVLGSGVLEIILEEAG